MAAKKKSAKKHPKKAAKKHARKTPKLSASDLRSYKAAKRKLLHSYYKAAK